MVVAISVGGKAGFTKLANVVNVMAAVMNMANHINGATNVMTAMQLKTAPIVTAQVRFGGGCDEKDSDRWS